MAAGSPGSALQDRSDSVVVDGRNLSPRGFGPTEPREIYLRPAQSLSRPARLPDRGSDGPGGSTGVRITEVTNPVELAEFEETSALGFGHDPGSKSGRWHANATLGSPGCHYLTGRVEGRIVSVSIACVGDGVVGIYGVATLPGYRRRGYGAALTLAAVELDPSLPAILEPSGVGASMYRSIGFMQASSFVLWTLQA